MIKTAVIGASGYLGRHLLKSYRVAFPDCIGTAFSTDGTGLTFFDIRNPEIGQLRLKETGHEAVLIAAAKPNIAFCEQQREAAYSVNVTGMLEFIRQIGRVDLQVVFLSSDYVFEGRTGSYDDVAEINPTTEYGRHKAIVEKEIPSLAKTYLILRLSKIYGLEKGDGTLLDEMASSVALRREIRAARDQRFCPTYVGDLVRVIHGIQDRHLTGTMNVCSPETWSRYDIAVAVAKAIEADSSLVKSISLYDIPSMAGRPLDTSMKCPRLSKEVGMSFTLLSEHIERVALNWKTK